MEDFIQLIVNNGLGIASFFALLYFMNTYLTKINDTIQKVSDTLVSVEKSLNDLTSRVDIIEKQTVRTKKKENKNDN